MRLPLSIAFIAVSLITVGTGCQTKVERGALETLIKDTLKKEKLELKSLACPDAIDATAGKTTECKAVDSEGTDGTVKVTWGKDSNDFDWGTTLELQKSGDAQEAALGAQVNSKVDVKCADKTVFAKPGKSFTCDATVEAAAGVAHKVDLTVSDDMKTVKSTLRPASEAAGAAPAAAPSGSADAPPAGSADAAPAAAADAKPE